LNAEISLKVVRNDSRKETKVKGKVVAELFVSSYLNPFLPGTGIASFFPVLSGI